MSKLLYIGPQLSGSITCGHVALLRQIGSDLGAVVSSLNRVRDRKGGGEVREGQGEEKKRSLEKKRQERYILYVRKGQAADRSVYMYTRDMQLILIEVSICIQGTCS